MRCAFSCALPPLLVAFDRVVGVSNVHLVVLDGCRVAGLDFDELHARLLSYVLALLVIVGAAWLCSLSFVIIRALCLSVRSLPTPRRFRLGLWVRRLFILEALPISFS